MTPALNLLRQCLAAAEPETDSQHLLRQHRHFVYNGGNHSWRNYAGHFFEISTSNDPGVDISTIGLQTDGDTFTSTFARNVRLTPALLRNLERLDKTLWELQDLMQDQHIPQEEAVRRAKARLSVLGTPAVEIVLDNNDKPTFDIEIRRK